MSPTKEEWRLGSGESITDAADFIASLRTRGFSIELDSSKRNASIVAPMGFPWTVGLRRTVDRLMPAMIDALRAERAAAWAITKASWRRRKASR